MSQPIQPLRIQKNTPSSSPNKMNGQANHGPLSEVGLSERRRNSPSWNQTIKKPMFQQDSSPFDSSPFTSNSPRLYWQNRDPGSPTRTNVENRDPRDDSSSPHKRSSIENLKRASRVKNSNMFAREQKQEYDPTSSPMIERPLANGRPLTKQAHASAFTEHQSDNGNINSNSNGVFRSPSKLASRASMPNPASSYSKNQNSPTKSSMSSKSRYAQAQAFDPESSIWSDQEESISERQLPEGKGLHRHAKSVTFDVAPPQVNEYEMTTPDPSVTSTSRDGSHDSTEDEEDESFDRGSSVEVDESFDASLEDTEKTPVVLPEDWRFMSPEVASNELIAKVPDPFSGVRQSPAPALTSTPTVGARPSPTRTDSINSNGERRPLPPLPPAGLPNSSHTRSDSRSSLSTMVESFSPANRSPVSHPQPASISKSEIQGMGGCSMPIEERLKLMMLDDDSDAKVAAQEQRERRLRRGSPVRSPHAEDNQPQVSVHEEEMEDSLADLGDFSNPPRISRESILRKVKSRVTDDQEDFEESSFISVERFGKDVVHIDPDTPLPTTEDTQAEPIVKREQDEESEVDVYSIPDLYQQSQQAESFMSAMEKLEAIKQAQASETAKDDDDASHYSEESESKALQFDPPAETEEDEGPPTPKAKPSSGAESSIERRNSNRMSLPRFAALLGEQDFDFGMDSFMADTQPEAAKFESPSKLSWTPSPPLTQAPELRLPVVETMVPRPRTPEEQLDPPRFPGQWRDSSEPGTPDSVIRRPIQDSPTPESPSVPEPVATIKASGSKLKTRHSATPADIQTLAETRRQVSSEHPAVPKIPENHLNRPSMVPEGDEFTPESGEVKRSMDGSIPSKDESKLLKRKSSLVTLDLPAKGTEEEGLGIESEFDRLLEAQKVAYTFPQAHSGPPYWSPGYEGNTFDEGIHPCKNRSANGAVRTQKGYLMRQNTKVIVASSASHESASDKIDDQQSTQRGTQSAGNSPRKASTTQAWTAEPWNGKIRRKSIRKSGGIPSKPAAGPVPPLPGQQSNVASGLDIVAEDEATNQNEDIGEDGERGRLFVKVVRVKDLDLPLPKGERSYFALTLDNGLHCVTTSWLELGKTAPIGQEFELVVLNDLEFQLTLQTRLEEPKAKPVVESPTKAAKTTKPSTFSRVFASPKKRKEMELKQQEDAQRADRQRQQDAQASRRPPQPTAWDLLHKLVAQDGSFARSYVSLKEYESKAYGKPLTVDVPCFNEWAIDEGHNGSSARSKRTGGLQRRPPYRVGKLELQLLYVPKPKGAKDEDMPKSMNACIRELKEAEAAAPKKWDGHLSQQGGDCPYWRRRYFSLDGSKFTAYHEATRQPRATINLAKASKLIDDKSALMKTGKGNRRKSAFAEEEEGYMFVEEGFRIRFANGETIDFYADSAAEKDGWMKVLADVVGKDSKNKTWTDLVLARHRAAAARAQQIEEGKAKPQQGIANANASSSSSSPTKNFHYTKSAQSSPAKSAPSARAAPPPTPAKTFMPRQQQPPVPEKSSRRSDVLIAQRRAEAAAKTRSMIF